MMKFEGTKRGDAEDAEGIAEGTSGPVLIAGLCSLQIVRWERLPNRLPQTDRGKMPRPRFYGYTATGAFVAADR